MNVQRENCIMKQLWSLRSEDPTQYYTLVKMHLSFATDLSTDQCDGLMDDKVDSPSAKSSGRWNLTPLIRRLGRPMGNAWRGVMEGAPLTQEGVCQAYQLIHYLNRDFNITQEGLFRKSGSLSRQQELKALLNSGRDLNLDYGNYSAHDCASVLKNFLADLPEPLLSESHYKIHCKIAEMNQSVMDEEQKEFIQKRQIKALRLLFLLLPHENYRLLKDLLMLLNRVTKHQDQNKMTSINLGTMFAPHILCPRKMPPNDLQFLSGSLSHSVAFMIDHCPKLFQIPIELEYDVRQYWSNKKTLKHQLSKRSMQDAPTSTIFTFVDRELTAQANNQDVTDVALAELYAYVQSLPDSAKKRRLIKQFNKESGPGTPNLNHSVHKKNEARVKSLGDSIKRHLFQKSMRGGKSKKQSLSVGRQVSVKRVGSEDLLTSPTPTSPELHTFRGNKEPGTPERFKAKSLDDLTSSGDDYVHPERLSQNQMSIVHPAFHPSSHLLRNLKRAPSSSLSHESIKERLSSTSFDHEATNGMLSPLPSMPSFSLDSSTEFLDVTEGEDRGNRLPEGSVLSSDELSMEMKTSILTGGSDNNITSPISQAVIKSSIPQRVIMTPRSRIPIIFNSSSSLSGVPIPESLEKSKDTADSPVILNPCASLDSPAPARTTHTDQSHSTLLSSSVLLPSLPSIPQNPSAHTEKIHTTLSNSTTSVNLSLAKGPKANSMSTLRRTLSSASSTGSLFGSFFKHLSTSSLAVLASRLTSSSSLPAAASEDSHDESLHVEEEETEDPNESLSSVFKDYLINRSILTDNPVDLSADCLHEEFDGDEENHPPGKMTDALEDSRDSACVTSSSSSTLASQQVSKASLASFDSAISLNQLRDPLSESLLYCLDGNNPDSNVCLRKEDQYQSGPKSTFLQDQNKVDQPEVSELHSCSPNGRQQSLLQNKQGTPVPLLEKDWQDSQNRNQGVLFETSF